MRHLRISILLIAVSNLPVCVSAEQPSISSRFIPSGIVDKVHGFRPRRADLSERLSSVQVMPKGLMNPRVGRFTFGKKNWLFVLDETDVESVKLFVDANSDGDMTNDPEVEYSGEKQGEYMSYEGSAKLKWNGDQSVNICFYRFDPRDKSRARIKNSMLYYADFGQEFTLSMDGKKYSTFSAGPPDKRVSFEIDRDGNGDINGKLETIRVGEPFNYTGTTYIVSLNNETLSIQKANEEIERMPLPLDLSVGQSVPQFTARTIGGKEVNFPGDFQGKIVLLDFWATWCGPCLFEVPHMQQAHSDWQARGFEILGVSVDRKEQVEKVDQIISDTGIGWDQIFEGDGIEGRIAAMYEVSAVPFVLLVDGDTGKIIATRKKLRGSGLSSFIGKELASRGRP